MAYEHETGFRPRGGFGGPREMHDATCSTCSRTTRVPFQPSEGRPIFCRECWHVAPAQEASEPSAETFEAPGAVAADGAEIPLSSEASRRIYIDVEAINDEILRAFDRDPKLMWGLTPRKFEEFVAELLARQGYEVTLTPPNKDGGFDIAAAHKNGVGTFLYLVECKRYLPPNKIGVGLVRSLYGVVEKERANGGIFVASCDFTRGAVRAEQEMKSRMALCDYIKLQEWVRNSLRSSAINH